MDAGEPPVAAPVQQTSADQVSYDAEKLAVKQGLRMRSAFVLGALLATVAAATLLVVSFRQTRALPFEMTSTTRLTSAGQSLKAAISPDGRYIAHTLVNSGQESLLVRRATTLHDIEIVPPAPVHYLGITFFPDSETVYYVTHTSAAVPAVLFRVPVMGGSAQKLKEDLASPVTFSPDGAKYAFVRESAGESTLMLADLDSGREQRLFFRKLPEILDYPAWSPDGRIIACTAVDSSMLSVRGSDARIIGVRVKDGSRATVIRPDLGIHPTARLAGRWQWAGDERPRPGIRFFSRLVRFVPEWNRSKSDGWAEPSDRRQCFR